LPIGVYQIVVSGTMGCALLLKAQARGRALLVARVVGSVSTLVLVLSLATTHGITGAAWGLALASGLSSLVLVACALGRWFPAPHALRVRTPRRVSVVGNTHVIEPREGTAQESAPD